MKSLQTLFHEHHGKISDKWSSYITEYDRIFSPYRMQPISLLEIGVQNGGSLEIWSKYFQNANKIVGCDINPKCSDLNYPDQRIHVIVGDSDSDTAESEILSSSAQFDLIIEDSSHYSSNIIKSFIRYFPHLTMGGLFIAEDLHCSYWKEYEGGLYFPYSSLAFFKRLVDIVNYEHWGVEKSRSELLKGFSEQYNVEFDEVIFRQIHSIEFKNSICVIRKEANKDNVLGKKAVAGQDDSISTGYKTFVSPKEKQYQYFWSNLKQAPEEQWEELTSLVSDRENQISKLNGVLADKDNEIRKLNEVVAGRDNQIRGLNEVVADRDNQIRGLNEVVADRDNQVISLNESIDKQRRENIYLKGEIHALRTSTSWKITAPIRWPIHQVKRVKHVANIFAHAINENGGLYQTISKGWAFYRREGLAGIKQRIVSYQINEEINHRTAIDTIEKNKCEEGQNIIQFRVDKNAELLPDDDVMVFVAYSPDGILTRLQIFHIDSYVSCGYRVILVLNSGVYSRAVNPGYTHAHVQIVRQNYGFDFGAWKHALNIVGGLTRVKSLTFTNDSLFPVGGEDSLRKQRESINKMGSSVVFLTRNYEIKTHLQSYFFCLKRDALERGALKVILDVPYYENKENLINEVEINISDRFAKCVGSSNVLYFLDSAEKSKKNPTIHHWEELLDDGFPYIKIQLITAKIIDMDDPALLSRVGEENLLLIQEHCNKRAGYFCVPISNSNKPPQRALPIDSLYDQHGVQQAYNPPKEQLYSFVIPFSDIDSANVRLPKILAIIHCYYIDVASEILEELVSFPSPIKFLLTTDESEKARLLVNMLSEYGLQGEVIICPNRGRDVAPFIIEGRKTLQDAEIILHLHTKKSKHDVGYSNWGKYLRQNLVGSVENLKSIFKIFESPEVGVVYSEHFPAVENLRNWGYDYNLARDIMKRMGITITGDSLLEFPTSTMFWARRDAISPLFSLGLDYTDFDAEAGQVDGTLAHAIERCILLVAESCGFTSVKVLAEPDNQNLRGEFMRMRVQDVRYMLKRAAPRLLASTGLASRFYSAVGEIYPVNVGRSQNIQNRLNIILPTMKPEKIYGGITTAIGTAKGLIKELPDDIDIRVLITSDTVDRASIEELSKRLERNFVLTAPNEDLNGASIVDLAERRNVPLVLRHNDSFFATAWWTADLAFRMRKQQHEIYGEAKLVTYLIQDYEPGFYSWSNKYALSEATYRQGENTIALINSEELASFMMRRYEFQRTFCIPYKLHDAISSRLKPTVKEKMIIAYGRPSISRNCFELLVEGLRIWQARNPEENCLFRVIFAGEDFSARLISELENSEVVGKLTIEDYAELLNRSAIGVSLMVSPHPSYPPLEMASAGCITITNRYEGKDLTKRASNIYSIHTLNPCEIADALEDASQIIDLNMPTNPVSVESIQSEGEIINYQHAAELLMEFNS